MDKDYDELIKMKKMLDNGIISQKEFDDKKAEILKKVEKDKEDKKIIKYIFLALVGLIVVNGIKGCVMDELNESESSNEQGVQEVVEPIDETAEKFKGECPVSVSATIKEDILGFPNLACNITNNTNQNILAVKVLFIPEDVYGDTVNSVLTGSNRYIYDEVIYSGNTVNSEWSLLDREIKKGNAYIYSVYFEDQTEWGDRELDKESIIKYAYKVNVN